MRLFQQQVVYNAYDTSQPAPPPPPPFLPDQEEEKGLSLLRESSVHLREGRQRLPTPDRVAIMELSSGFEKRRLGKQQQILSEITQRCREQEVTDLSSKISARVELRNSQDEHEETLSYYGQAKMHRKNRDNAFSTGDPRDRDNIEKRLKSEKGYKFFPARKIMRQPGRLHLFQASPATSNGKGGHGGSSYREAGYTAHTTTTTNTNNNNPTAAGRVNIDFVRGVRATDAESRAQILDRQTINGPIQLQHYLQPKLDAMAPLLLPDVHGAGGDGVGGGGGGGGAGFQDRIDTYFSSTRLSLNQRSRSFYDASSISGRSYRSLNTGGRPNGSRHQLKSMRSDRGGGTGGGGGGNGNINILQQIDDDVGIGGFGVGAGGGGSSGQAEVPIDLKSSAQSTLRAGSQKV